MSNLRVATTIVVKSTNGGISIARLQRYDAVERLYNREEVDNPSL